MFRAVKLKDWKITLFSLLCVLLFVAACWFLLRSSAPDSVTVGGESVSLQIKDDADITAFAAACGCAIGERLCDSEIIVPKHWNERYVQYNEMQRQQGFDLVPYKGKPARKADYALADGDAVLSVLIGNDRIIAAHLCDPDGENMRPLEIRNEELMRNEE